MTMSVTRLSTVTIITRLDNRIAQQEVCCVVMRENLKCAHHEADASIDPALAQQHSNTRARRDARNSQDGWNNTNNAGSHVMIIYAVV